MSEFLNIDCIEYMKTVSDKYFELAIVDPPYNVGASDGKFGQNHIGYCNSTMKNYINYNAVPEKKYFDELFRISKNQIIWGSNYYPQNLYHSGAIIWHKKTFGPLSDCEIAFQSFNKLVRYYYHEWVGFNKGSDRSIRIHPNQKPVELYLWLLKNYAKPGDKIFDSHVGSASSLIACEELGFEYAGCELDVDYYNAALKRLNNYKSQLKLF